MTAAPLPHHRPCGLASGVRKVEDRAPGKVARLLRA